MKAAGLVAGGAVVMCAAVVAGAGEATENRELRAHRDGAAVAGPCAAVLPPVDALSHRLPDYLRLMTRRFPRPFLPTANFSTVTSP